MGNKSPHKLFERWVDGVYFLAKKLSVWAEVKKGLQANEAPSPELRRKINNPQYVPEEALPTTNLTIPAELLQAFIDDIDGAELQFKKAVADGKSCKEIHAEYQKARRKLCNHLQKLREINNEQWPNEHLNSLWKSYRCRQQVQQTEPLERLRLILETRYNEGELRTLSSDLNIDYDSLPGRGKADTVRELIEYLKRRNRLPELIETIGRQRSDIASDEVFQEIEAALDVTA